MSMRVVFMGTPAFAVSVLHRLTADKWDIVAAYTQPDKPKNRGMKLVPTPVKEFALTAGIPVRQPESCRDEAVLEQLRALEQALLDIPKRAIINVHSSLLPQYRGAAPINWAILNGDRETGVTIQYMAAELDAGDILLAKTTPIDPEEDAGQLYERRGAGPAGGGGRPQNAPGVRAPVPVCVHAFPGNVPHGLEPSGPGAGQPDPRPDSLALRRHGCGRDQMEGLPGEAGRRDGKNAGDHPLRRDGGD